MKNWHHEAELGSAMLKPETSDDGLRLGCWSLAHGIVLVIKLSAVFAHIMNHQPIVSFEGDENLGVSCLL